MTSKCNLYENIALIALGANLPSPAGTPAETLQKAVLDLAGSCGPIRSQSRFFATPCFPPGAGPDYVNAALCLEWGGGARALLTHLHRIEANYARERTTRWGMRTLDLDLIAIGQTICPDTETHNAWRALDLSQQKSRSPDDLVLPHPRVQDRSFVLVPLMDVAPDWTHPVTGLTVAQMLAARPAHERSEVVPL